MKVLDINEIIEKTNEHKKNIDIKNKLIKLYDIKYYKGDNKVIASDGYEQPFVYKSEPKINDIPELFDYDALEREFPVHIFNGLSKDVKPVKFTKAVY